MPVSAQPRRRQPKISVRARAALHQEAPSLLQWPRLTSLELGVEDTWEKLVAVEEGQQEGGGGGLHPWVRLEAMLLLPIIAQPLSARQRLSSLLISREFALFGSNPVPISPLTIASLAPLLPNLRELTLETFFASPSPVHSRAMHAALATLPQLESLFMPANVLEGVEALRTSLRRLELRSAGGQDFMITPDAVACINQLEQLNDLFFSQSQCSMDVLLHLLNVLPLARPELEILLDSLAPDVASPDGSPWLSGYFGTRHRQGLLHELPFTGQIAELSALCSHVLLPSQTLGLQRGPTVTLHRLHLGADPMPPSEVEPLRAFAQRCASIELGEFHLSDNPSSAPALQALQLLGATAATALVWTLHHNAPEVTNSLSLRLTGLAACFDQQPPGAAPAALPEPAEVLQRALDRIPPREGWESCTWPQGWGMPALVLHGPFVGTLAYTPGLVLSWLEGLTQTAVPVGEGHGSVQWLQDGGKAVFAALLLPSASAVLVVCNGGQGVAEALMAGALAAARDRPQGTLHVRPLGTGPHQPSHYISRPVQQVAQEAFSAGVGHGAARCLEWVTSLATFLQGLPAPMQHRQR